MKFLALTLLFTSVAFAAPKASQKILPVTKEEEAVKKDKLAQEKLKALDKKEDCDEKAKKPVEITPQSISLGGTAGCSLDDAH